MISLSSPSYLLLSSPPSILAFYFLLHLGAYALLSKYLLKRVEFELTECRSDAFKVLQVEKDILVRERECMARERDYWDREKANFAREKDDLKRENERLTRENERIAEENEARGFALEREVEELQRSTTVLNKSKDDAEARVLKQATEFSELKAKWANERVELQAAHTLEASRQTDEISALAERVRWTERM